MRLSQAIESIQNADRALTVVHAPTPSIALDTDALLIGSESFALSASARRRFLAAGGAPTEYLRRMGPAFEAHALATHVRRGDFGTAVAVSIRTGEVVGIGRGDLTHLTAGDVTAVEEGLGSAAASLSVTKIEDSGDRLVVELTSQDKRIDVRPGDSIDAGLQILHHRFGKEATVINAYILRLMCSNGMTARQCVTQGAIVRTRKLPVHHPNGHELQRDQVRRLAVQTWAALEPRLAELQATQHRAVEVESVFDRWLSRARMSVTLRARLMEAWHEDGAEATQYGAVNAITRVATHDRTLSQRQRLQLSALGGLLAFSDLHICKHCFSVL